MSIRLERTAVSVVCALFLAVLMSGSAAHAQSGAIQGRVVSADAGVPLPDANILLRSEGTDTGTSTDAEGRFRLSDLSPGTYVLRVTTLGYAPQRQTVEVRAGATTTLTVRMRPQPVEMRNVVVSATRQRERIQSVPTSVSVLGPKTVETQTQLTSDVGDVLAQTVPGLAPTTHSLSNFGQTIRGRSLYVLIDGVPQTVPLRNVLRGLRTVDPGAIERVEVVRGASATYGYGGNGGLINFITERPDREGVHGEVEVGTRSQPADLESSTSGRIRGEVQVQDGRYEALVSTSYEGYGYFFDGEGDRIPQDPQGQGGLAGGDEWNVLARGGVQLAPEQRLEVSANLYSFHQDIEYATVAGTPDETKATAHAADDVPGKDPGTRNVVASLRYIHDNFVGGRTSAHLFLQDYETRFAFASFFPDGGGQSVLDAEKLGARLDVTTPLPLPSGSNLHWGVDALGDETAQPLEDGRIFVPEIQQWSVAPFAQLQVPVGDRLRLRGGARFESFWLSVDDYTTLFGNQSVEGGDLSYDALVFNAGAVFTLFDGINLFGSFSQGYSVADVGRVLRSPPSGADNFSVEALRPDAQKVNSYEVGVRGGTSRFEGSVAGFLNTSDRGSTFGDFPELALVRSPERVYGLEATLDVQVHEAIRAGGTATVMEGRRDANQDGDYEEFLPNSRIPPTKITGYVTVAPSDRWRTRLQLLYSGSRDKFDGEAEDAFGQGDVHAYTIVDLSASVDIGPGTASLGVENLFDNFYFPTVSQWWNFGSGYSAAPGRQISLGYTVSF